MFFDPLSCLALAIYWESRGETLLGRLAVGQVVLHRVRSPRFPNTVCEVVKQRHQFSFYWDGKSDIPTEKKAWEYSVTIADALLSSDIKDLTNGADHYARSDIIVDWMFCMERVAHIGKHVFYKSRQ